MPEVPEEQIREAEQDSQGLDHAHPAVAADDGSLGLHLTEVHGLPPAETVSPSTQKGLHDRLHQTSKAADD